MAFDGPYGVYHSQYDNHQWVARVGDPGFRYHEAMTKLWGVMALRLANADALPLDYRPYASRIGEFARTSRKNGSTAPTRRATPPRPSLAPLREPSPRSPRPPTVLGPNNHARLPASDRTALSAINTRLLQAERALLDPAGIPGRPWYRHQIYAPKFTYAPELLPASTRRWNSGDAAKVTEAVSRISAALDRSAKALIGE